MDIVVRPARETDLDFVVWVMMRPTWVSYSPVVLFLSTTVKEPSSRIG